MARTIVNNDPSHGARHVTLAAADEHDRRLDEIGEHLNDCGELRVDASTAHASILPLVRMQREMIAKLDDAIRGDAIVMRDAKEVLRESVPNNATDREVNIAARQSALDGAHVRRLRDRLGNDEATKGKAEKLATRAADALRSFGTEIDKRRDASLFSLGQRSIQEIMNDESQRQLWRARPDALPQAKDLYTRLVEREQVEDQIALEHVLTPLLVEVRDASQIKRAMQRGGRQPTVRDEDRTIAISLLAWFERQRQARLPEWLHVAAFVHSNLREAFCLVAGHHGRYESFESYMRRRSNGGALDPYAIANDWIWRAHPSTPDLKRAR